MKHASIRPPHPNPNPQSHRINTRRVMSNSWSLVTMTEPTERDVELDQWVHDHPDTLVVFGAGNNGFEDGSFNPGSVQSPATAKTAMTVGRDTYTYILKGSLPR